MPKHEPSDTESQSLKLVANVHTAAAYRIDDETHPPVGRVLCRGRTALEAHEEGVRLLHLIVEDGDLHECSVVIERWSNSRVDAPGDRTLAQARGFS